MRNKVCLLPVIILLILVIIIITIIKEDGKDFVWGTFMFICTFVYKYSKHLLIYVCVHGVYLEEKKLAINYKKSLISRRQNNYAIQSRSTICALQDRANEIFSSDAIPKAKPISVNDIRVEEDLSEPLSATGSRVYTWSHAERES